jgi:Arc/MetJ-type ribon-helix-helix transcriptional regulator
MALPAAEAERIEALVTSREYASAGEVVREALLALDERNVDMDEWLRQEVGPAYDEIEAHRERVLTAEQVAEHLRSHDEGRARKTA